MDRKRKQMLRIGASLAAATLDWTPPLARRRASVSASRPAPRAALDVLRDALADDADNLEAARAFAQTHAQA